MLSFSHPLARLAAIFLLAFSSALYAQDAVRDEILARATAAIDAATPRAQADPWHPIFHVSSPAQWMNDPNGPIYDHGWYHLFYQLYPFNDSGGPKYWGHVRSRNLAKWERLPIALWPSTNLDESEVWSGCCTINGLGQPMAFYTSIAPGKSPGDYSTQWAALSKDQNLIRWRKSPANPILTEALNGPSKIYDWRDPFIFHYGSRTFLVDGGNLNRAAGGQAVVNIYEAQNPALTQWTYRGVLFHLPGNAPTAECPNFFQLGRRWVLFVSPYGKVQCYVGDFDPDTCRFHPLTQSLADFGPNFYAPNTMEVPDGRRIVWGWVTGFPAGHGWNGCLTVPRLLSISADNHLIQKPAPELRKLRGHRSHWGKTFLSGKPFICDLPPTNTLEIEADLALGGADNITLTLHSADPASAPVELRFTRDEFLMPDTKAPLVWPAQGRPLDVRLFLDRSVLEVFVDNTVCATKTMPPPAAPLTLQLAASGPSGQPRVSRLAAWPIKTIW